MEFIAGVCPQCGGQIELNASRSSGFCQHCGVKIYTKDMQLKHPTVENYVELAKEAYESGKKKESERLVNKALSLDPRNANAWYIKLRLAEEAKDIINCSNNLIDISTKNIDFVWRALESKTYKHIEHLAEIISEPTALETLRMQFEDLKRSSGKIAAINGLGTADQKLLLPMAQDVENRIHLLNYIMRSNLRGNDRYSDIGDKMADRMLLFFENYFNRLQIYGLFYAQAAVDAQKRGLNIILNYVPTNKANAYRERQRALHKKAVKKSACYIATAVYGDINSPALHVLRGYRDDVLQQNLFGRLFIKVYYALSPPIASWLKDAKHINGWVKRRLDRWVSRLKSKHDV